MRKAIYYLPLITLCSNLFTFTSCNSESVLNEDY